ncbi:MAG: 8-oxo-dGTP diphosphatase MutT [Gammaproteobacteria bacterium]|nr:8-oxo-dGTP diphosphatase MutT [Gammaproteobacteria bacterium]
MPFLHVLVAGCVPSIMHTRITVAAGVIRREDGRVLVARRPRGKHMAGAWEFPGGKVRQGETPRRTLDRELHEELGISVRRSTELMNYEQEYPDRLIELHFFAVEDYDGSPGGREGQELCWEFPENLGGMGFLPADRPLVELLIQQTASLKGKSAR